MLDATKPLTPAWKKYGTMVLLPVLIVVAGYVIWVKELHHAPASPALAPSHQSAAPSAAPSSSPLVTVPSTIPGGIPISSRNPFGS